VQTVAFEKVPFHSVALEWVLVWTLKTNSAAAFLLLLLVFTLMWKFFRTSLFKKQFAINCMYEQIKLFSNFQEWLPQTIGGQRVSSPIQFLELKFLGMRFPAF